VEDGAAEGVDCGEARGGVVGKYHRPKCDFALF
jgi:hypothetical protein